MIRNSDLLALKVLAAVIKAGSISQAATALHVTQPAVSNALAKLRLSLKDELFIKQGRRQIPTERAKAIAIKAERYFSDLYNEMHQGSVFNAEKSQRTFSIGLPDYLELLIAPKLIAQIRLKAPEVRIFFRRNSADDLLGAFERGEIDLAISKVDELVPWLHATHLLTEHFLAVGARETFDHHSINHQTISLKQFIKVPQAMVSFTGEGLGQVDAFLQTQKLVRRNLVRVSSFNALAQVLLENPLIAVVPHPIAAHMMRAFNIENRKLGFKIKTIEVHLIRSKTQDSDAALLWLSQLIIESVQVIEAFEII